MSVELNKTTKILLIEDDEIDAKKVTRLLKDNSSFHVIHATTLEDGLAHIRENGIDLVLLDLGLPDADTPSASLMSIEQIKHELPVLILTRNNNETLINALLSAGAQDYLDKGEITGELLVRSIRYSLERQRLISKIKTEKDELDEFIHAIKSGSIDAIKKEGVESGILRLIDARVLEENERLLKELKESNQELSEMNRLMVGREVRMLELKKIINNLNSKLGNKPVFDLSKADLDSTLI